MLSVEEYLLGESKNIRWREFARSKNKVYYVSEKGDVAALSKKKITPISRKGYDRVNIEGKPVSVHRLVAEAFIPNPDNKPQVNHIDGRKRNNQVNNLEWVTSEENQLHAIRTGLKPIRYKYSDEDVRALIKLVKEEGYSHRQAADKLGVGRGWASGVLQGKIRSELTGIKLGKRN